MPSMKLHVLLVSVGVFLSRSESAPWHEFAQLPVLMHIGEEHFFRLDHGVPDLKSPLRTEALKLQLTQGLLEGMVGKVVNAIPNSLGERDRRSEDSPISLDLTFHLLREVLQMARAEQLAQRATNNRKMMDFFGK